MQKADAAAFLASLGKTSSAVSKSPTNIHIISGEVGTDSSDGFASISVDGLVFSEEDDQFVEMAALGGLEEGDLASVLLIGEEGKQMTPLVLGSPGSIDRIRDTANDAGEAAEVANALAELANEVANAINQFFWTDDAGVHITQVPEEDWNDIENPSTYHSGPNVLITSLGQLFRDGYNNLLALLGGETPGVAIYNGEGNDPSDIVASFTGNLISLGRNSIESVISFCNDALLISAEEVAYPDEDNPGDESGYVFKSAVIHSKSDGRERGEECDSTTELIMSTSPGEGSVFIYADTVTYDSPEHTDEHMVDATIGQVGIETDTGGMSNLYVDVSTIQLPGYFESIDYVVRKLDADTIAANDSYSITTAGIDNLKNGPHISVPEGKWLFVGTWTFNSGASSGTRNLQVGFRSGSSGSLWGDRTRIMAGGNTYAIVNTSCVRTLDDPTTVYLAGSSSMTNTAATCYITAIRLK